MLTARIILASRSPRRRQLLTEAGYLVHSVDPPFADPPQPPHEVSDAGALACDLARLKAESVLFDPAFSWVPGDVLLAADTIVIAPPPSTCLLGQPDNALEARSMLERLLGSTHQVVTGVALCRIVNQEKPDMSGIQTFADLAQVTMGIASTQWLEQYLQAGHWRGKAGGYNLAELHDLAITVQGDPTTVVGLPMQKLTHWLEKNRT